MEPSERDHIANGFVVDGDALRGKKIQEVLEWLSRARKV
jgi:hypothetical protein